VRPRSRGVPYEASGAMPIEKADRSAIHSALVSRQVVVAQVAPRATTLVERHNG
jgi:hypothetical protein